MIPILDNELNFPDGPAVSTVITINGKGDTEPRETALNKFTWGGNKPMKRPNPFYWPLDVLDCTPTPLFDSKNTIVGHFVMCEDDKFKSMHWRLRTFLIVKLHLKRV